MRRPLMCQRLRSAANAKRGRRSTVLCRRSCSNTLSSTDFTPRGSRGGGHLMLRRRPRQAAGFTDFFIICSGTNTRQVRAIADGMMDALAATGAKPAHVEGYDRSEWILLDDFDFIVHVFAPETRIFYGLERLW